MHYPKSITHLPNFIQQFAYINRLQDAEVLKLDWLYAILCWQLWWLTIHSGKSSAVEFRHLCISLQIARQSFVYTEHQSHELSAQMDHFCLSCTSTLAMYLNLQGFHRFTHSAVIVLRVMWPMMLRHIQSSLGLLLEFPQIWRKMENQLFRFPSFNFLQSDVRLLPQLPRVFLLPLILSAYILDKFPGMVLVECCNSGCNGRMVPQLNTADC